MLVMLSVNDANVASVFFFSNAFVIILRTFLIIHAPAMYISIAAPTFRQNLIELSSTPSASSLAEVFEMTSNADNISFSTVFRESDFDRLSIIS